MMAGDIQWEEVERLFDAALDVDPANREAQVLSKITSAEVRAEVEAMLAANDRGRGILDRRPLTAVDVRSQLQRALIDRYTIGEELGRGGSAAVFRALEHKHERTVVLKVLHPDVAAQMGADRFLAEVRIAAQLSHPHILPLIDSGEVDGLLYYVMPHLEGETLRARLDRVGALAPAVALGLLRDVADALRAAHAAGIIHRDLKPDNILCAGDHAYLLDFGIAAGAGVSREHHTGEGIVVGTLGYMSPEQAAGGVVGLPSDVYAWGVLAREMLTGKGPMDPLVSLEADGIPSTLASLVTHALERDPARRPPSGAALMEALSTPPHGMPVTTSTRRAVPATVWAALAACVLAGAVWLTQRGPSKAGGLTMPVAVAPLRNETGDTTLAIWGRMAGDWLTQGLHETGLVTVVPWPSVRYAAEQLGSPAADVLAREVGAGTLISGAYYLTEGRIGFRIDVTDIRKGALIASLPPVVAPRESLEVAIRQARERVMGLVAVQFDERAAALPGLRAHPPTFAAYQAFDRGLALYNQQEYAAAGTEFRQAWIADSTFAVPLIYAAMAHWNLGDLAWVDTLVTTASRARNGLSEYDQRQLEYLSALMASDGQRALVAGRRATEIAPASRAAYHLGRDLMAMDRAAEGRRVLEGIDPDRGFLKGWPSYWTQLAHARHLTAAFAEERAAARRMRERFPDSRVATVLEARALGALGQTDALDSLLAQTEAMPAATYWSHGGALVVAGEELFVHRDSVAGRRYLERAVRWLEAQHRLDPKLREHRYWLGSAYYDLGRWKDADTVFSSLARDLPERLVHRGMAAVARARMGDTSGALTLLGASPQFAQGEYTMFRSRLAAIAGDSAGAHNLRTQALSQVVNGWAWVHAAAFRDVGIPVGAPASR